jgi:two-component system, sensor histidine kinase LadS
MIRRTLCLFILFYFFTATKAEAGAVKASYYILEDQSLALTAEQAFDAFKQNNFTLQTSNQFNPGFTKSVYWLAVKVDSAENSELLRTIIGNPHINTIEAYIITQNKPSLLYISGDHFPYRQRPILTVKYSFPLSSIGKLYLFRIDKHNESLQLTFDTLNASELTASESNNSIITGMLTGIIVLLLIFGIYLSFITGKRIYIFYVLYITSGWLWVISDLGYGFKYLWPGSTWFASRSRPVFSELTIALSLQYLVYYLGGIRNKLLKRALLTTSFIGLGFVFLWLIPVDVYEAKELSWVMLVSIPLLTAIYVLLSITTLSIEAYHRNTMALFYLGALVPLMLLVFVNLMNHSGMLNISGTSLEHYGVATGYVCEAIILTFGLVYRFNMYRLEKEKLQVAFERQQKENAKALIDTEAKERRKIADELHDIAGSMLSAAKLNISSIKEKELFASEESKLKLQKAEEAITAVASSVRNLSHALSPVMLEKVGFKKSIEKVISFFNSSGKIQIETLIIGFDDYDASLEHIYTVLYGITYEFLNNIVKHSGASNAILQLIEHDDSITLIVEDNGAGFKAEYDKQNTKGIAGIISKINYFNGSIEFDSGNEGLTIAIEIPKRTYEAKDSFS